MSVRASVVLPAADFRELIACSAAPIGCFPAGTFEGRAA